MSPSIRRLRPPALFVALAGALALLAQCRASSADGAPATREVAAAWDVVYQVLQHPRCMNCHPGGDVPLQGDASLPHAQNVQRGPEGQGLFALRCDACHQTANLAGAHLPPGAPHWQLPHPEMPLVFQGKSSRELCRQLSDRAQNGNRSPAELLAHLRADPLVLWGWSPGEGRAPVPVPHAAFVAAARAWIEGGCGCPE